MDIKRASDFVTVSWNRFFNHSKTMLLGHDDGNAVEDRGHLRGTYHHNWFDSTNSRHPRVRFGNPVHVFNNYFENNDDPYHRGEGDSPPGTLVARDNVLVTSGTGDAGGSVAAIPYSYPLENPGSVKGSVTAGASAGVGRINV